MIVDEYSRYTTTFTVDNKLEIPKKVNHWLLEQHIKHKRAPELITTDKGSEFTHIEYLLPESYSTNETQVLIQPTMNYAPTGNKQWNGISERTVQSIKLLRQLLTAHLQPNIADKFMARSYELATFIYNHLPHSSIGYDLPYGRYFTRPTGQHSNLTQEEKENRFMFIDSLPARIYNGDTYTLPQLPLFLEDVEFFIQKNSKTHALLGHFVGYNEQHQYIIQDAVLPKVHEVVDIKCLQSFKLVIKEPIRYANEPILPIYFTGDSTLVPIKIPTSFPKADNDILWRKANDKEINSFLNHNVFEEITGEIPDSAILLHTFWLFTLKHPTNIPKSRLITINREWVGHKQKDASSPVAKQQSNFFNIFRICTQ